MGWPDVLFTCAVLSWLMFWFWRGDCMRLSEGVSKVIEGGGTVQFGKWHLCEMRGQYKIFNFGDNWLSVPEETYNSLGEAVQRLLQLTKKEGE